MIFALTFLLSFISHQTYFREEPIESRVYAIEFNVDWKTFSRTSKMIFYDKVTIHRTDGEDEDTLQQVHIIEHLPREVFPNVHKRLDGTYKLTLHYHGHPVRVTAQHFNKTETWDNCPEEKDAHVFPRAIRPGLLSGKREFTFHKEFLIFGVE